VTPQKEPGSVVRKILEEMEAADRMPFLAWVEQNARQAADLELLREIRAYRRSLSSLSPSSAPTRSDG
jgi:hypothetical protein